MRNKRLLSLLISASLIVGQMGITGVYAAETKGDEVVTYEDKGYEKPAEVAEDDENIDAGEEVKEESKPEAAPRKNSNDPADNTDYAPMPIAPDLTGRKIRLMADGDGEEVKKADIAFVIDMTGSMSDEIASVSQNLAYFIDVLESKGVDLNMSLVEFQDIWNDGPDSTIIHRFGEGCDVTTVSGGNIWTTSGNYVKDYLSYMSEHIGSGGDTPETPTDALNKLLESDYGWRDDAQKFVFLLTDAEYKVSENSSSYPEIDDVVLPDTDEIANIYRKKEIKTTVVSETDLEDVYGNLYRLTGGKFIDIRSEDWYLTMVKIAGWIVSGTSDTDGDGLLDEWETSGMKKDEDGVDLDLPGMGADPERPDIFVEIDHFVDEKTGAAFKPDSDALRMVWESFDKHGINLHIDAGPDSVDYVTGKTWGDKSGANEIKRDFSKAFNLGSNYSNWNEIAIENFDLNRCNTFRYCLFVNKWETYYGDAGSSGIAENVPGQFFIVADAGEFEGGKLVGGLTDKGSTAIGGTFMHELGHTLGLDHGGIDGDSLAKDGTQYKPNYLSIMNYLFQFTGLVGTNELNYSEYKLPALDETALDESKGFDPAGLTASKKLGTRWYDATAGEWITEEEIAGKAIDFNGDGNKSGIVDADINKDGNETVLASAGRDWDNIVFMGGLVGGLGEEVAAAKKRIDEGKGLVERNDKVAESLESEVTLKKAEEMKIAVNPGTCTVGTVLPSKAFKGIAGQKLSITLESIKAEDATVKLKVESKLVGGTKEQDVKLEANKKTTATVDIDSGVDAGSYTVSITATDADGREAVKTATVTVEEPKSIAIDYGKGYDLSTISFNSSVSPKDFTWKSLNETIVAVNGTTANGVKPGEAGLIAYAADDAVGAVIARVGGNLEAKQVTAGSATYEVYVTKEVSANGKAKHLEKGRGTDTKKKIYDVEVLVYRDGVRLEQSAYKTKFKKNKKPGTATVIIKLAKSTGDKAEKKVMKKQRFNFTIK